MKSAKLNAITSSTHFKNTAKKLAKAKKRNAVTNWLKLSYKKPVNQSLSPEAYDEFEAQNLHHLILCQQGSREKIAAAYKELRLRGNK